MKKQSVVLILFSLLFFEGCNLKYMDKPPLTQADRWRLKEEEFYGYSKHRDSIYHAKIFNELLACGYDESTWNIEQQKRIDNCMLNKDFIFIDSPFGTTQMRCDRDIYKELPSCKQSKGVVRSFISTFAIDLDINDNSVKNKTYKIYTDKNGRFIESVRIADHEK